ncbi:hypothetical protein [Planococcus halotolerans]|uniref:Uncharacterized protein n=1 Tax=Planococcus halotolerans TaxID=2233542 RepID=A0A365KNA9_9BACL|nr:hypothetical protein [Planococcus halotolerans]QHJ71634.1 hypothetical protein DNR44_013790 [Planococcus halotolerans]RAZ74150.1 hypothetical protein DP120_16355 [Planococcus halotolerans]
MAVIIKSEAYKKQFEDVVSKAVPEETITRLGNRIQEIYADKVENEEHKNENEKRGNLYGKN